MFEKETYSVAEYIPEFFCEYSKQRSFICNLVINFCRKFSSFFG